MATTQRSAQTALETSGPIDGNMSISNLLSLDLPCRALSRSHRKLGLLRQDTLFTEP
jgi:hypothetical protein